MNRFTKFSLCFLSTVLVLSGCQKKDWDDYYGRPKDLAPPIYQQLQAKGNFTSLLALIDKAEYKDILGNAGSWTLFAANDAAFQKYFTANNTSLDKIDAETARKIVLYGLIYNPLRKDQLTSNQTSLGSVPNTAYRRQTAYYDFVYTENGKKVVDNGQNGSAYNATINNNKYIPFYVDSYLSFNGLASATDVSPFFPGQTFSGFDVSGAKVLTVDIPAENGIIHEVDKVLYPLPNVDQYLKTSDYSEFKKLLDKFVTYTLNDALTKRYNTLTGAADPVYLKWYSPALSFSPNNENYVTISTDAQAASWSIAVPTNQEVSDYVKNVLLEYYPSFEAAPASILTTFINSHMWRGTVWPSRVTQDPTYPNLEPVTFTASNIIERKVLSNAHFYGINQVTQANVFRTVYGKAYLNPAYALQTRAIDGSDLRVAMLSPQVKFTLFLTTDAGLNAAGYVYDPDRPAWGYSIPPNAPVFDGVAITRINRAAQTAVLYTPFNEFDNLAGEGVAEAFNGEYVKFKANQVQAAGNVANNTFVTVSNKKTAVNGISYNSSGLLLFPEDANNMGFFLDLLAKSTDNNVKNSFSHFYNYLVGSSLWNPTNKTIAGVDLGVFYTLFVPTNAAIETAVKAGRLPGNTITGIPTTASGSQTAAQRGAVERMILYSIISKATVAIDGKKADKYQTLLKNPAGDSRLITVRYSSAVPNPNPNTFELVDDASTPTVANAIYTYSNNPSNRSLIHSINKVLNF